MFKYFLSWERRGSFLLSNAHGLFDKVIEKLKEAESHLVATVEVADDRIVHFAGVKDDANRALDSARKSIDNIEHLLGSLLGRRK